MSSPRPPSKPKSPRPPAVSVNSATKERKRSALAVKPPASSPARGSPKQQPATPISRVSRSVNPVLTSLPTLEHLERDNVSRLGDASDEALAQADEVVRADQEAAFNDSVSATKQLIKRSEHIRASLYTATETAEFFRARSKDEAAQAQSVGALVTSLKEVFAAEAKRDTHGDVTLPATMWRVTFDLVDKILKRHTDHSKEALTLAKPLTDFCGSVPAQLNTSIKDWKDLQTQQQALRVKMSKAREKCVAVWTESYAKFQEGKSTMKPLATAFAAYDKDLRAARKEQLKIYEMEEDIIKDVEGLEVGRRALLSESRNAFVSNQHAFVAHFQDSCELYRNKTKNLKANGMIEGEDDISKAMLDALKKKKEKMNKARANIAREIMTSEESYLSSLAVAVKEYLQPLKDPAQAKIIKSAERELLFSNIEPILTFNSNFLVALKEKVADWHDEQTIADVFLKFAPFFKLYTQYFNNHAKATELIDKLSHSNKKFSKFLQHKLTDPKTGGYTLTALLITPIQRVPRYRLLLQELLRKTHPSHPDFSNLNKALEQVKKVASELNAAMGHEDDQKAIIQIQNEFEGRRTFIAPHRTLVLKGEMQAKDSSPSMARSMSDKRGASKNLFVLFNDMVVIGKKSSDAKGRHKWKIDREITLDQSFEVADDSNGGESGFKIMWTAQPAPSQKAALTRMLCPILLEVGREHGLDIRHSEGIRRVANDLTHFAYSCDEPASSMTVAVSVLCKAITTGIPALLANYQCAKPTHSLRWASRDPNVLLVQEVTGARKVLKEAVKIELTFGDGDGPVQAKKEITVVAPDVKAKKTWMKELTQAAHLAMGKEDDRNADMSDGESSDEDSDSEDDEDTSDAFSRHGAEQDGTLMAVEAPLFEYGLGKVYRTLSKLLYASDFTFPAAIIRVMKDQGNADLMFTPDEQPYLPPLPANGRVAKVSPAAPRTPANGREEHSVSVSESAQGERLVSPVCSLPLDQRATGLSRCLWSLIASLLHLLAKQHKSHAQNVFGMTDALDAYLKHGEAKRREFVAKWTKVQMEKRSLHNPILTARRNCKTIGSKLVDSRKGISQANVVQLQKAYTEYATQLDAAYREHRNVYDQEQDVLTTARELIQERLTLVRGQRGKAFESKRRLLHTSRHAATWLCSEPVGSWLTMSLMSPATLSEVTEAPEPLGFLQRPVRPKLILQGLPITQLDLNLYRYLDVLLAAKGRLPRPDVAWRPAAVKVQQRPKGQGEMKIMIKAPAPIGAMPVTVAANATCEELVAQLPVKAKELVEKGGAVIALSCNQQTIPQAQTVQWAVNVDRAMRSGKSQGLELLLVPRRFPDAKKEGYVRSSKDNKKKKYTGAPKYLCLLKDRLQYYVKKDDKKPKGEVLMSAAAQVDYEYSPHHPHMLALSENDTSRKYYIVASDEEELAEWRDALRALIASHGVPRKSGKSRKEGYLLKAEVKSLEKGLHKVKWSKRYIVVLDDRLQFFKSATDPKPAGEIPLQWGSLCEHFHQVEVQEDTCFTVASNSDDGTRVHCFRAESQQQKAEWLADINDLMRAKAKKKHSHSIREGYLEKTGLGNSKWHQRFCLLLPGKPARLRYYKQISGEKEDGEIKLTRDVRFDKQAQGPEHKRPFMFSITVPQKGSKDGGKKVMFSASSLDERARWLADLITAALAP